MVRFHTTRKQKRTRKQRRKSRRFPGGGLYQSKVQLIPVNPVTFANTHGKPLTNIRHYEVNHNKKLQKIGSRIRRPIPATLRNPANSNYQQLVAHQYARLQEFVGNDGNYNKMMNVLQRTELPSHLPPKLKNNIAAKIHRNHYVIPKHIIERVNINPIDEDEYENKVVSEEIDRLKKIAGNHVNYNTLMNVLRRTDLSYLPPLVKFKLIEKMRKNYYNLPHPGIPDAPAPNALNNSGPQPMNINS